MASTGDYVLAALLIFLIGMLIFLLGVCCRLAMKYSAEEDDSMHSAENISREGSHGIATGVHVNYGANESKNCRKPNTIVRKETRV